MMKTHPIFIGSILAAVLTSCTTTTPDTGPDAAPEGGGSPEAMVGTVMEREVRPRSGSADDGGLARSMSSAAGLAGRPATNTNEFASAGGYLAGAVISAAAHDPSGTPDVTFYTVETEDGDVVVEEETRHDIEKGDRVIVLLEAGKPARVKKIDAP